MRPDAHEDDDIHVGSDQEMFERKDIIISQLAKSSFSLQCRTISKCHTLPTQQKNIPYAYPVMSRAM